MYGQLDLKMICKTFKGMERLFNVQVFLNPKISCGFKTKLGSFGHTWRNHFPQKLNVRNEVSNHRIFKVTLLEINLKIL
jgi:hypothetical protein